MTSVEDVFRPAFEEISRRQNVTSTSDYTETPYFAREGDGCNNLPYVLPGQNFALVTMGTNVLAPRPVDPLRPSIRVYGAFDTKEEAIDYNRNTLHQHNVITDCYVVDMYEWVNVLLTK